MSNEWAKYQQRLDFVRAYAYATNDISLRDSQLRLFNLDPREDFLTEDFLDRYTPEYEDNRLRRRICALTRFLEEVGEWDTFKKEFSGKN